MKPLVRWTIGGTVREESFLCLEKSIYLWKKLYGEYFNYAICCNNFGIFKRINKIKHVSIINQKNYLDKLPFYPKDTFWKFCPPRLSLSSHEIIIDNDLLIYNKSPTISWFLSRKKYAISTAAHKAMHGCFVSCLLKNNFKINTGLIGLPPNYDFNKELKKLFLTYPFTASGHCDDQGAFLMLTKKFLKIIPMEEIHVCNPNKSFAKYKKGSAGIHLAGLNTGAYSYVKNYLNTLR